jgi:hypothetical protein
MEALDIKSIKEAYESVYEINCNNDELEEVYEKLPLKKMVDQAIRKGAQIPGADEEKSTKLKKQVEKIGNVAYRHDPAKVARKRFSNAKTRHGMLTSPYNRYLKNDVDYEYNLVLEYLLDNDVVNTMEEAEWATTLLNEELIDYIVERYKRLPAGKMVRRAAKNSWKSVEATDPDEKEKLMDRANKIAQVAGSHNSNKAIMKSANNSYKYNNR